MIVLRRVSSISIVVDIDDTLLDVRERLRHVMCQILDCVVSLNDMRSMTTAQIFNKYASSAQKAKAKELHKRFWDITLCNEDIGFDFLHYDEPFQNAARVLETWNEEFLIVYLTGRIESTRKSTLSQLRAHGFPIEGTQLVMFQYEDYNQGSWALGLESVGLTLMKIRSKYFSLIVQHTPVLKVIDDFPNYFSIYRNYDIPELIGMISTPHHEEQHFLDQGATRVIRCWSELLES